MTEPPVEGTPAPAAPDYKALIEEQKAIIVAMNEKVKKLEDRAAAAEAKISALSGPAPKGADPAKLEEAKSALDTAYEQIMKEYGYKE